MNHETLQKICAANKYSEILSQNHKKGPKYEQNDGKDRKGTLTLIYMYPIYFEIKSQ